MKTITRKVTIPPDRQLTIPLPEEVPPGPAELTLVITPDESPTPAMTAGDLLGSPLFGLWKDRTDITDSVEYARQLRAAAEQRSRV